jgi:hypothetical protein
MHPSGTPHDPQELAVLPGCAGLPDDGRPYDGVILAVTASAGYCRSSLLRGSEFLVGGCRQPVKLGGRLG